MWECAHTYNCCLKHCAPQPKRKSPHVPSTLLGEDACLPNPPGPVWEEAAWWESQAYFLQNPQLLRLMLISTFTPCTIASSCISPSYTWFLLVLALSLILFSLGQGSPTFLYKGQIPNILDFVAVGCLSQLNSATMNMKAATEIGEWMIMAMFQ